MRVDPLRPEDLRYNGETSSYEALVTLHDAAGRYTYACSAQAPLNMPVQIAVHRLVQMAKQQHAAGRGLRSCQKAGAQTTPWDSAGRPGHASPHVATAA